MTLLGRGISVGTFREVLFVGRVGITLVKLNRHNLTGVGGYAERRTIAIITIYSLCRSETRGTTGITRRVANGGPCIAAGCGRVLTSRGVSTIVVSAC